MHQELGFDALFGLEVEVPLGRSESDVRVAEWLTVQMTEIVPQPV
jgi:hypothetical protein